MDLKLKKATIVDADKTNIMVVLLIQKKNKIKVEHSFVVEKKEMDDCWDSLKIDEKVYDFNFFHEEKGKYKATLYPVQKNGEVFETVTSVFSGCDVKTIPLNEYNLLEK